MLLSFYLCCKCGWNPAAHVLLHLIIHLFPRFHRIKIKSLLLYIKLSSQTAEHTGRTRTKRRVLQTEIRLCFIQTVLTELFASQTRVWWGHAGHTHTHTNNSQLDNNGSALIPTWVPTFPNPVLVWPNRPVAVPKPVAVLVWAEPNKPPDWDAAVFPNKPWRNIQTTSLWLQTASESRENMLHRRRGSWTSNWDDSGVGKLLWKSHYSY